MTKQYGTPSASDGLTEDTRWRQLCAISPQRDSCTGELAAHFRSLIPDPQMPVWFNEGYKLVFSQFSLIITFAVPRSLVGQSADAVAGARPDGWDVAPTQGPGWQQWFSKNRQEFIKISQGDTDAALANVSDAGLQQLRKGPYFQLVRSADPAEGPTAFYGPLEGNPVLSDANGIRGVVVSSRTGTTDLYGGDQINPTGDTGESGGGGGGGGDGGGGGGGAAGGE